MIEQAAGELRAKLMGSGGAWPDNEPTHKHTSATQHRRCGGHRRDRRARLRHPRAVTGPGRGAGGRRRSLARLRDDAPSAARTARGRATAHGHTKQPGPTAGPSGARNTSGAPSTPHIHARHNKTARPQWGRAAVAVALGFEPRVAVTPHSISSAAPSAARTRYLTRILYYTLPLSTQIDRAGWEQGHTATWEQGHTATRSHTAPKTSAISNVD